MGLIEQAAKRLEELRRAGVEPPRHHPHFARMPQPAVPVAPTPPAPEIAGPREPPVHIDLARLAEAGFVTPDQPDSSLANEFRILKRPLIANARAPSRERPRNLIMVTSAMPGEGKSFAAVNLAMSIAMELDRSVLLVDADAAAPSLAETLGVPERRGLLDLLEPGGRSAAQAMVETDVRGLQYLASGQPHSRTTEALASEAMRRLLEELATSHPERIVIFDSPPLLVTTEARVLANRMGQVVFVVSAESTLQSDVKQALATIEECPLKFMVLNRARTPAQGAYGYGYGYGRSHGRKP
jgi:exopolysaccharide/PEP-CTERM locus tyrosine autokinase